MLPKPPPRETPLGFLYLPPYRVIGTSIAGETTTVLIPELDIAFDMGECPRPMLTAKYVAVSHGHMDHIGGLAYYCSQRVFQGMSPGTILCSQEIAPAIRKMLEGYRELERQNTPFEIIGLRPDEPYEIKNNIVLKGFPLEHRVPTFGFTITERRSKLKPELVGLPQEKLMELRAAGQEITRTLEIPLVAYVMDTAACPALVREDVRKAQILILECTFFEPEGKNRAKEGQHIHVKDLAEAMKWLECQKIVLGHISRRTHLVEVRKQLLQLLGRQKAERIELLMDTRTNRERYERQLMDAGEHPTQLKR
jgi:ribonuclease Z